MWMDSIDGRMGREREIKMDAIGMENNNENQYPFRIIIICLASLPHDIQLLSHISCVSDNVVKYDNHSIIYCGITHTLIKLFVSVSAE